MNRPIVLLVALTASIILLSILFPSNSSNSGLTSTNQPVGNNKQAATAVVKNYSILNQNKVDSSGAALQWSPDGKMLYYSKPAKGGHEELWVTDMSGSSKRIGSNIEFSSISDVKWSPDGRILSFISTLNEKSSLFIYNTSNGELKNITPKKIDDVGVTSYDWDDESLNIIMSIDLSAPKIQIYSISSGKAGKVDINIKGCSNAAFYRSGKIIFSGKDGDGYSIFTADMSGKNVEKIIGGKDFIISPDRYELAILSDDEGQEGFWLYNLSSKTKKELLLTPVHNVYWISNGDMIYSTEEDCQTGQPYKGTIYYLSQEGRVINIKGGIYTIFVPSNDGAKIAMTLPQSSGAEDSGVFTGELFK